ncbi:radical SAM protein [Mesorhizobium sp. AR10]|uniref:radical SAM protein n=1 Tax=Mesorhizobium sp. AR10 TaxID=2865839 RepID=UPI00215F1B5C|nr:radical SAM protein [Mesorhizobium sp. AR10]UVK37084.1 radical SAM protein [Mesorhizobium sp. AR10]
MAILKRARSLLGLKRPVFQKLELHVAHGCNLSCESCSHYSNHAHAGTVSLEDADCWMGLWSRRVSVTRFSLLGGEPTIHPELPRFVGLVRRHWPDTRIEIVSNGFFLHRHPTLPAILAADPAARLVISVHHDAQEYRDRLKPVFALLEAWRRDHGVVATIRPAHKNWTRRYEGFGEKMLPFEDSDPRASWDICPARHCKQLHEGRIWKCAPLAYLPMQKAKYRLSGKWDAYLGYEPLGPDCSRAELQAFAELEDEAACGMCPAKERLFELPVPLRMPKSRPSPVV